MRYEICYLVGESKEMELEEIKKRVAEALVFEKAELLDPEISEKRKLAYRIGREIRGTFVARRFNVSREDIEASQKTIANIGKKLNLDQDILRFLVIKADNLPPLKEREAVREPQKEFARTKYQRTRREIPSAKPAEKRPEPEKQEKTVSTGEEIDKKIEEILNI